MHGIGRRPSVPDRIEADPIAFVDELHEEYVACEMGYKEARRDLLQQCGFLTLSLKNKKVFDILASHPFWTGRQKPKRNGRGKWAVYMMLQPKSDPKKKIASKYGLAIDVLFAEGVSPENFADTLRDWGGIGATAAMHSGNKAAAKREDSSLNSKRGLKRSDNSVRDLDQDEEQDDQKNGDSNQAAKQNPSVKKASGPGMMRSSDPEDDVIQGEMFSRSLRDNLLVRCSGELMQEALRPGKIMIEAEVWMPEGELKWVVKAISIQRISD